MECPYCQADVEEEAVDCPKCGELLKTSEEPEKKVPALKKEELLAGLRSSAGKTAGDDSLPSEHWEDYTASLLEVLFDKHLVFPAEIDRELKTDKEDE